MRGGLRWALGVVAVIAVAAIAVLVRPDSHDGEPGASKPIDGDAAVTVAQWPRFRGPGGAGRAPAADYPLSWDARTGENILWRSRVPLPGASSPIVHTDRVYLTGATPEKRAIFAFDLSRGELLWTHDCGGVPDSPESTPRVHRDVGFAAATPTTDGERIYAVFANGDIVVVDRHGDRVWSRALGLPRCRYGFSSSPVLWGDLLLLQLDQSDKRWRGSHIHAFDKRTGEQVWVLERPVPASYTTPIVYETEEGSRLFATAPDWYVAYDLETPREAWRVGPLEPSVDYSSSPVAVGDRLLVTVQGEGLAAIRTGGQGDDVWESHLQWFTKMPDLPDVISPVSDGDLAFVESNHGVVTCLDMENGEPLWELALPLQYNYVSPSLLGDRLLVVGGGGSAVVLQAGRTARELSRNSVGDGPVFASPAFAVENGKGRMFFRVHGELVCVGAPPSPGGDT